MTNVSSITETLEGLTSQSLGLTSLTYPWRTGEVVPLNISKDIKRTILAAPIELQGPWQVAVVQKLAAFARQPRGWDGYKGEPLRPDAGFFALQVLVDVMSEGIPVPHLVPTSSGGVQIEWHRGGWDIEVDIQGAYDAKVWVYFEPTDKENSLELSDGNTARLAKILEPISTRPAGRGIASDAG
jgi:hypothetical protein